MGLFDYVVVECPVEGVANPLAHEWQTKTFDWPYMETYKITEGGRLLTEVYHTEDRSDPTAEPGSLRSFAGCMTRVRDDWRDTDFHGDLNFYSTVDGEWVELIARFTDGQLQRITRVEPDGGATP
jgi:hypothetical protein